jgi:type I restriction enzyme S subunit
MNLPLGWLSIELDGIMGFLTSGSRGWAKYYADDGAAFIRVQNVQRRNLQLDLRDVQHVRPPQGAEGERTKVHMNDILVTITADLGRVGLFQENTVAYVNQHVALLRLIEPTLAPYISAYLLSNDAQMQLGLKDRGVTRAGLGLDDIRKVQVPLPPLAEQRRIVVKLNSLASRLERARVELDRALVLASGMRRSALDAAFNGSLTSELRNDENGVTPTEMPDLDDQERGVWKARSLPHKWRWVTFGEFLHDVTDSKRKVPENAYERSGVYPVIDQGKRPVGGYTNRADLVHAATRPVIIFGDHTRCVKLVHPPFAQGADGVKVLMPSQSVDVNFARYALLAVDIPAKGYSRHMKLVRKTMWPLPGTAEQAIIAARLDSAFAHADRLEAEATRARELLDRLESAILAKAFRGELVPQDPSDEPARVLLDRVCAERAAAPKPKRGRRAAANA